MRKSYSALPKPGEAMRGETGRIGYLLRQANTAHRNKIDQALKKFKITLPQYSVLAYLAEYPGISSADLARLTLLTPQTVFVIVANLERRELIKRNADSVHGRIQNIHLTNAGKKLHDQCTQQVLLIQEELTANLSAAEEKIIRRWLVQVAVHSVK